MSKPKRGAAAAPAEDHTNWPQQGGSFIRMPDGSLVPEAEPDAAEDTAPATLTEPAADDTQSLEG